MSQYTREEILKMIEENGGPEGLDLSGADLRGIDLSKQAITKELERYRKNNAQETPAWFSLEGWGLNLQGAILEEANLSDGHLEKGRLQGAHLEKASLVRAHLEGASLWGAHLEGAGLGEAHLEGAGLADAHLARADLWRAHLQEAFLEWAHLEEAFLAEARLEDAYLAKAHLEGADLEEAHLQEAFLEEAHLERADLWGAHLEEAFLKGAHLEEAFLAEAHLEDAYLAEAHLEGADLTGANLNATNLWRAHLEKVDLSAAASLAGAYFHQAWLDQTRMAKDQLGGRIGEEVDREYYRAKEAYLLLKNNFNQTGRYDDASWAYVKERQMEKMTYHPKLVRTYYAKIEGLPEGASPTSWAWWRFYVKYTLKWVWDWIIEALCGYGERPQNVLAVASVVLVIIFPFLYFLTGLAPTSGQNLLPRDYFLYSLYSFATMEHPTLQATCWAAQLFTGLESLSGIAILALLMYTLGRRISRS